MFEKADIRSVVILIDEYDVPLTYNLENKERFDSVAEVLKALYSTIKYYANKLRFVFITGITRYKDAAFFTLGNTILDVSLDPTYATIAGLTRDEIKHYYLDNLKYSATKLFNVEFENVSDEMVAGVLDKLEFYYDGYCFDRLCSKKVFSTWSVLNYFINETSDFLNFWYDSAGLPSILVKNLDRIKEQLIDLINNEYIYVKSSDFENPSSLADMQPAVLLYQTGYLTLAAPSNKLEYQLTYPNEEVKQALTIQLASQVFSNESEFRKLRRSPLDDMQTVDEIVDYFNSILNLVDYEYYPLTSESAVINSIMLFLKGQDKLKVAVNSHSSKGRCDLQVDSDARRLVFEFKFAKIDDDVSELLQKACTQLQDRRYGQSADSKGEILQIALVFSQEQRCITAFEKI